MAVTIENLEKAFDEMFDFITDLPSGLDGFESDFDAAFEELKELKAALTPPNEPLTLEQLREMDGKPFYDCASREWYIVDYVLGSMLYTAEGVYFNFGEEETTDRFYRRPPEGEEEP